MSSKCSLYRSEPGSIEKEVKYFVYVTPMLSETIGFIFFSQTRTLILAELFPNVAREPAQLESYENLG